MTTGDFPAGKEFNCPDCPVQNGHSDAMPQINFCAYCNRKGSRLYIYTSPKPWVDGYGNNMFNPNKETE